MVTIGVDIGGTNLVAGLVDEHCNIIAKERVPSNAQGRTDREIVDDVIALCRAVMRSGGVQASQVRYVGVGTPGSVDPSAGEIIYTNNLPFLHTPICRWVTDALGLPCLLDNDANVAALGEVSAGSMKDCRYAVMVTLGTGVGGGVVVNGKIYSGFNFAGAEIGHHVIQVGGRPCTCGRLGCWEAYASATGLKHDTREAMKAHPDSAMWQIAGSLENVSGKTAFDAMRAGDAAGRAVVDNYIFMLAQGLGNIVSIFQPEALALGGGICNEGETLLAPLRKLVRENQYYRGENQTELRIATLGNDAGVIGAARLGEDAVAAATA
jgi:glucokinase